MSLEETILNLLNQKVDKTTTINSKPLVTNIELNKIDINLSAVDNISLANTTTIINNNFSIVYSILNLLISSLNLKVDKTQRINNVSLTSNNVNLSLDSFVSASAILSGKESITNKNQPNGYAGLDNTGKIPTSLLQISGLNYKGIWNASTNTPTLTSSSNISGDYYKVSTAGSTSINGISDWNVGDWIIFNGSNWDKIDNTDFVTSVNGYIGNVVLTKSDIDLSFVDNTSDLSKPVSVLQQALADTKVDKTTTINTYPLSSDISLTKSDIGLSNVDNTSDIDKPVSTAQQILADTKVDKTTSINSHPLSSNITLTKSDIGLSNVDNTSDINKPVSTAQQILADTKADKTTTINTYPLSSNITLAKADIGLSNVDNTSDSAKPISTATQTALNLKADKATTINSYPLSSNITLVKGDIGLGNVDNTSDSAKPISIATQTALNLKESLANKNQANGYAGLDSSSKININQLPISGLAYLGSWNASTNSPTIQSGVGSAGNYYVVSVAGSTTIDSITNWHVSDWIIFNGSTWEKIDNSNLVNSVNGYQGVIVLTKSDIGLSNVDNTSDVNKPVSTATQTALNLKVDKTTTINSHPLSSNISITKSDVGLGNVDNTSDSAKPVSTATQTALNLKADKAITINTYPLSSDISLSKADIGLSNVDNTADINKPVSSFQQTALNLKESLSNKNQASGYAGLDSSSKIASSQLPTLTLTSSLNDVNITSVADGESLVYNQSQSKWVNSLVSGGGGGGGGFSTSSGNTSTSYNLGIGTSTPTARLDIETPSYTPDLTATVPSIVNCPCDEFGYGTYLKVLSNTSFKVIGGIKLYNNSNTSSDTTFTNVSTNSINYVYMNDDGSIGYTSIAPEYYLGERYTSCMSYLSMENKLEDACVGNAWFNNQTAPLTFSNSIYKYGSQSLLVNTPNIPCMFSSRQGAAEHGKIGPISQLVYQHDFWIYPLSFTANSCIYKAAVSYQGYGITIYTPTTLTTGTTKLLLYISTNGSSWNAVNGTQTTNSITMNQWNYISIRYTGTTYILNINGVDDISVVTSFLSSGILYYDFNESAQNKFYLDEYILTPYLRPLNSSTPFDITTNSLLGSPFALLLNGSSLTDLYGVQWYSPSGSIVQGPSYPTTPSISINSASNQWVHTPYFVDLRILPEWTLESQIYVSSTSTFPCVIFENRFDDGSGGLSIRASSSTGGSIYLTYLNSSYASNAVWVGNGFTFPSNTWFHFALTYSRFSGYKVYINGIQVLTSTVVEKIASYPNFYIGRGFTSNTFIGYINDFRVTPKLIYTSSGFTVPSSNLTVNVSRDLINPSTGVCTTQGLNSGTSNRVYIGCVRLDNTKTRHYSPKMNTYPLAKIGDNYIFNSFIKTPSKSYLLPSNKNLSMYLTNVILTEDGKLLVGSAAQADGCMGVATLSSYVDSYLGLSLPNKIKKVYIGHINYWCVDESNIVWTVGYNGDGSMGLGSTSQYTSLTPVFYGTGPSTIVYPSGVTYDTGNYRYTFIIDNGNMYATGNNAYGQLGLGNRTSVNTFTLVPKISSQNWSQVWGVGCVTFAITDSTSNNKLYVCGYNNSFTLGVGTTNTPTYLTSFTPCVFVDGTQVTNVKKVIAAADVVTEQCTTFVLLNDGNLYVTGRGSSNVAYLTIGVRTTARLTNNACFIGPIAKNIVDVCVSGGEDGGILLLRSDNCILVSSYYGTCFSTYNGSSYINNLQEGFFDFEKMFFKSIYSVTHNQYIQLCALTFDGSPLFTGISLNNAFGGYPIGSTIYYFVEPLVGKRVKDLQICYSNDGTTQYSACFALLENGKILTCGYTRFTLSNTVYTVTSFSPPIGLD